MMKLWRILNEWFNPAQNDEDLTNHNYHINPNEWVNCKGVLGKHIIKHLIKKYE